MLARLIEAGIAAGPQQYGQRIAHAATAVHLEREIEALALRLGKKIRYCAQLHRLFRKTGEAGKHQQFVDVVTVALGEGRRPRQADQRDLRLRRGGAQGP